MAVDRYSHYKDLETHEVRFIHPIHPAPLVEKNAEVDKFWKSNIQRVQRARCELLQLDAEFPHSVTAFNSMGERREVTRSQLGPTEIEV